MGFAPILTAGLGLAGSAMGAMGSAGAGEAQKQADFYQAQIAQYNSQIALQNAEFATEVGTVKATNESLKTRALVGQQKAGQGANNIDVNKGSAVDVRAGTEAMGQLNALTAMSDAARENWGFKNKAWSYQQQSNLDIMAGKNAVRAGDIGAVSSLLSGVSGAAKGLGLGGAAGAASVGGSGGLFGGGGGIAGATPLDPNFQPGSTY